MRVAGVDGWRARWVAVVLEDGRYAKARVLTELAQALDDPEVEAVGIDVPIGYPEGSEPRPCDVEARRIVGARRSSVFLVPPRMVLAADRYDLGNRLSRTLTPRGISQQTYGLRLKILEAEGLVADHPHRAILEVHPEVSFVRMNRGEPLPSGKKTWNGLGTRIRLLEAHGIVLPPDLGEAGFAGADDVVDAAAVAWSAHRFANDEAEALPERPADHTTRGVIWH
jgi:predicted RNase H-like nuclease